MVGYLLGKIGRQETVLGHTVGLRTASDDERKLAHEFGGQRRAG
jgi:hypothetical protein